MAAREKSSRSTARRTLGLRASATSARLQTATPNAEARQGRRPAVRGAEARCTAGALRPAARARRHAQELGGDAQASRSPARSGSRCAPKTIRCSISTSRATFPRREYGGGAMIVWDRGRWEAASDPEKGLAKGHLDITLAGNRLKGAGIWCACGRGRREKRAVAADQGRGRVRAPRRRARHHRGGDHLRGQRPHHRRAAAVESCARITPAAPR